MKNQDITLSNISAWLPTITTIVILLGVFNIQNFYGNYGIPIFSYLEIQEILFSFVDYFEPFIVVVILQMITNLISTRIFPSKNNHKIKLNEPFDLDEELSDKKTLEEQKQSLTRFVNILKNLRLDSLVNLKEIVILLITGIAINFAMGFTAIQLASSDSLLFDITFLSIIYGDALLFSIVLSLSEKLYSPDNARNIFDIIYKTFYILLFIFLLFYFEVRNSFSYAYNYKIPKYSVSITLKDNIMLQSNDSLLYVGSTKNYIFFKNRNSQMNTIIPVGEIRKLEIKRNRSGL